MHKKLILLNACFFLFAIAGYAQQFPFIQYTPKDGLVNSRVRKIYQDSRGRMYFLTFGGLSVYDGSRFRNYNSQNGLLEDMVNDVIEMGQDSFLVATNAGGINLLENGTIKPFTSPGKETVYVNNFIKSEDGHIYATSDRGLYKLTGDHFEQLPVTIPGRNELSLFLASIVEFKNYFVFISNDLVHFSGIFLYDKKKKAICDADPLLQIPSLAKDRHNRIWLSIANKLCMLDTNELQKGKLKIIPAPSAISTAVNFGTGFFAFDNKYTWIVHNGEEIVRIGDDGTLLRIPGTSTQSLPGIANIFIDRENILWFTNEGAGVSKLVNTNLVIEDNIPGESVPGFISNVTYVADTAWYILRNNGLLRKANGRLSRFKINIQEGIIFVAQNKGRLVVSTNKKIYESAVPTLDQESIEFRNIYTLPANDNMGSKTMYDMYGNLFFNTQKYVMVLQPNGVRPICKININDLVDGIEKDKRKHVWVVTRYSGLFAFPESVFYGETLQKPVYQFVTQFGNMSLRSMTIDKNDLIWIGTRSSGLMGFELKDDSLVKKFQFRIQQGITDNFITSLGCDSSNNIIVGSQSGIDRLVVMPQKNYRVENITKSNNIFGYISRIWVDKTGEVNALRNAGSLLTIARDTLSAATNEPDLFIEEMKVNGVAMVQPFQDMVLPYYQRNISFSVAAPSFLDEKQIQYSYRLLSEENNEWNEPSGNAGINLLNLSSGKYSLHIRADFPSTPYRSKEMKFSFRILPPWWETWWFRILAVASLIGLIILFVRGYFKRKLEKEKILLEKKQAIEEERTRIATDMHDDLGAGLSRIKYLSETIRLKKSSDNTIHDEVEKISAYSDEMVEKMGEIVWALNQKNDTLADLIAFTRSYASDYLMQHDLNCNTSIEGHIPEMALNGETRRNIFLSVKESLHNIVKHAQATGADLIFYVKEDFRITIRDNGKGFDMRQLTRKGNGLDNISKRMQEVNGRAEFLNQKGTTVVLTMPMHQI